MRAREGGFHLQIPSLADRQGRPLRRAGRSARAPTTPRPGWPPGRTRRGLFCTRGPGLCRRHLTGTAEHQGRHDGPDPTPEPPASRPRTPRHGASVGSNAGGAWPHARPHTRSGAWVCRTWRRLGSGWFKSQLNLPPRASRSVRSGFPQGHRSVPRGGGYGKGKFGVWFRPNVTL